jgi:ABC-type Mn2+/Zn2+ transport system permease subunit
VPSPTDLAELPFLREALFELLLLAVTGGVLGAWVVLRQLAFFTHAAGSATFPGLVVADASGISPMLAGIAVALGYAGGVQRAGRAGREHGEGTALLLVAALATGVILASDVFESGSEVDQLLFGSLLAIGNRELIVAALVLAFAAGATALARRTWIATGFDEEAAPARSARRADWLLLAAISVAVVASLDAVGALLVGAILVVPAATARLFARSVRSLEAGAAAIALAEGLAGLLIAFELDVPPGAAIATLSGVVFAACLLGARLAASLTRGATA